MPASVKELQKKLDKATAKLKSITQASPTSLGRSEARNSKPAQKLRDEISMTRLRLEDAKKREESEGTKEASYDFREGR